MQHSYALANNPGASFRADANNALAAIVGQNSGASAPTTTFAYMLWADTTTGLLKQRDSTNAVWIVIGTMGQVNLGLALAAGNSGQVFSVAPATAAAHAMNQGAADMRYAPIIRGKSVGDIFEFSGLSAPAGSLACPIAQTNISRTTYAALFAAIGVTWGAGDGSTTFGMPWFSADYASVQAAGNVGTQTAGSVIAHTHLVPSFATTNGSGGSIHTSDGANTTAASSTGGAANFAAGVRVLKCVQYQ